ncbi:MAG: molybdopterin molybdotransferase MoeA [Syntrophomonas sp.]
MNYPEKKQWVNDKLYEPVSLDKAVSVSCSSVHALDTEWLHIYDAYMRVAADNIASFIDIPNFDRSAMDGYAIGKTDLERLQAGRPLRLRVVSIVGAGSSIETRPIRPGETCRIMTGALLPEGSVAVIKQEDVEVVENYIIVSRKARRGENIRRAGHELRAGDRVAAKGQVLKAEILERIAACGIEKVPVYKTPCVFIIDTGNELLLPGSPIKTGCIYCSNRSLIACKVTSSGAVPLLSPSIVNDDLQTIVTAVKKAVQVSDMVIVSGGTGNGLFDLVHNAFEYLNAQLLFKGINVFPGKSTSAALLNGKLIFNLSGSPSAAGILFEALVKPALLKLKGESFYQGDWFNIELGSPIERLKPGRSLHRGEMVISEGQVYALPVSRKVINTGHIPLLLDIQNGPGEEGVMVKAKLTVD